MSEQELREQTPVQSDGDNAMVIDAPATPDEPSQPLQTNIVRNTMATTSTKGATSKSGTVKDDFGLPGSAWTTKKAKEEYDMAAAKLVHFQWNMNKYGDPLLRHDAAR